jgi:hypothetical protein
MTSSRLFRIRNVVVCMFILLIHIMYFHVCADVCVCTSLFFCLTLYTMLRLVSFTAILIMRVLRFMSALCSERYVLVPSRQPLLSVLTWQFQFLTGLADLIVRHACVVGEVRCLYLADNECVSTASRLHDAPLSGVQSHGIAIPQNLQLNTKH